MKPLHTQTMTELAHLLATKAISSVELTRHFLDRIQQFNQTLNCFISICEESALAQAKMADARIATGNAAPMTGIPMAQKDIFCTDGIKTTCGSKMLDNFIAPYDATVVKRLKKAGAVLLGKTNMDEFAMGSSGENSYYGCTKNPWDLERVPGGSSSGSSSAVAARLVPLATGTDTGGSIRQPAAYCGITGLKPTYGRVSRYGMIAYASSLDHGGPMTYTAEDAARALQVMAGYDDQDSTSIDRPTVDYSKTLNDSLAGLRIGLPKEYFSEGLDPEIATAVQDAVKIFEGLGATIKEITLPHNHLSLPAYYIVAPAECSSNLARYDGVHYGYRCDNPKDMNDLYYRTRAEGFGKEVKRRIMVGTFALSSGYYDAYYLKAQKVRQLISQDYADAFKEVDVILGPTTPTPAFKLGEKIDDPISMYLMDIYTIPNNLAGFPGISIPAGLNKTGLPLGIQLSGHYFGEAKLLNVAHQFQKATDWHQKIPRDFA